MRIVSFSDIHFCSTWPKVTLDDIVAVHGRLVQFCLERRPDLVIFLGDRFRARQPRDHVRAAADRCMRELSAAQAQHGGACAYLVGNHDRYSESLGSGHSYTTAEVFGDVLSNVTIMADPKTYRIPIRTDSTITGYRSQPDWLPPSVYVHALPSGYRFRRDLYEPDARVVNVLAFHGVVQSAVYDVAGNVQIRTGLSMQDLDDAAWQVVLGGDVHTPQRFDLQKTWGGYVGSTLRLEESDGTDKRGWLDVAVSDPWGLHGGEVADSYKFVESDGPRFMRGAIHVTKLPAAMQSQDHVGNFVTVELTGTAQELRDVPDERVVALFPGARAVDVRRSPTYEMQALLPGIVAETPPFDTVVAYLRASDRDGFDLDRMIAKAATSLGEQVIERRGLFR